ncbi:MAG: DNA primase [Acidobacteria bacterium]|nr:DNA primase [Acidobacteriota bacterium]
MNGSSSISINAVQKHARNLLADKSPVESVTHAEVLRAILESLKPSDELKNRELKEKLLLVYTVRALLKTIEQGRFRLARKNDFVFVYNGCYWREIDRDALRQFLSKAARQLGVFDVTAEHYEFIDKLCKQFFAAGYFEEVEADADKVLVNLRNGTFEITATAQRLRPFNHADFLKHQLHFDYDEKADAPLFRAYLDRVLPELELQMIVAEYFGYVFTRNLKFEKALLLYGGGANGKSVMFDVMNALLGKENTVNYSVSDLMQEHNRAQIANKLLNYGSEINAAMLSKDIFKTLVSNEPIMARLKYGQSFQMEHYAKLCFNCNELPRDAEQTDAYFRRLLIVPFNVRIPDNEQDKSLAQKIIATELSGVFNWVLDGLKRLLRTGNFSDSQIVREAVKTYRDDSDSVACFLKEAEAEPNGLLKNVYKDYRDYSNESGLKPLGKQNFRKRLQAHGYSVEKIGNQMEVSR